MQTWPSDSSSNSAAVLLFQLGDARLELGDLLRLRLVRVAVMARAGLLLAQRRVAVSARRRQEQSREGGPKKNNYFFPRVGLHSARLRRSSISGGGTNPVTRVGPSPGTAHSGGLLSRQAIMRTVGSPG